MSRLATEFERLYLLPRGTGGAPDGDMVDGQNRVRAAVLEVARPADWQALAAVWNGVQAELGLPVPAIAISGTHGYQLWFSLQHALPAAQALAFVEALRLRYLGHLLPQRVALWPQAEPAAPARHAARVPALQAGGSVWSAFVAADLAPMFADEPWLDSPPNPAGQAELLARLQPIAADDFQRALQRLAPSPAAAALTPAAAPVAGRWHDPRAFLLHVMNDENLAMALRIEAAKALLSPAELPSHR